jgi:hypothetical protein
MKRLIPPEQWAVELDRYTGRNAGRRAILEMEDVETGPQRIARRRLWGVSYDPSDGSIEILFGEFTGENDHLSHTVVRPSKVELQQEDDGWDAVLRIGNPDGLTSLRVPRPGSEPTSSSG